MVPPLRFFVLVEGDDDERFFNSVALKPLEEQYGMVTITKYAQQKPKKRANFIRAIKANGWDYLYVADNNHSACVSARKTVIREKVPASEDEKILVVIKAIESWYLAGLDAKKAKELGLPNLRDTNTITWEQFDSIIPKRFGFRINFMLEILKRFSMEIAIHKNRSFRYFAQKRLCVT